MVQSNLIYVALSYLFSKTNLLPFKHLGSCLRITLARLGVGPDGVESLQISAII